MLLILSVSIPYPSHTLSHTLTITLFSLVTRYQQLLESSQMSNLGSIFENRQFQCDIISISLASGLISSMLLLEYI